MLDALRLGAYQLLRTRVPPHAAVVTTVELVRADAGRARGFVNASCAGSASAPSPRGWPRSRRPRTRTRSGTSAL